MIKKTILITSILLSTTSCATLFTESSQSINLVPSNGRDEFSVEVRQGSKIFPANVPGFISVDTDNKDLILTVKESNCFKPSQTVIPSKTNLFVFANALAGLYGLTSTTTDRISGAAWKYDNTVYINARKKKYCRNNEY